MRGLSDIGWTALHFQSPHQGLCGVPKAGVSTGKRIEVFSENTVQKSEQAALVGAVFPLPDAQLFQSPIVA